MEKIKIMFHHSLVIHTYTYIYVHIHTQTFKYVQQTYAPGYAPGYAAHSGRATGSWPGDGPGPGDEHTMHSVPGRVTVAERDS